MRRMSSLGEKRVLGGIDKNFPQEQSLRDHSTLSPMMGGLNRQVVTYSC